MSTLAVRTAAGWELTTLGKAHVLKLAGPLASAPTAKLAADLRAHLGALSNPNTAAFVEEAVKCYEADLRRAAVVLSWVGAVSVLYEDVISNSLGAFNTEASRRDAKWRSAKNSDDLARMKESTFLDILESISVIGASVKQELKGCLKLRNGCGHPNSLKIGQTRVSSHIETLILNVFSQFGP